MTRKARMKALEGSQGSLWGRSCSPTRIMLAENRAAAINGTQAVT